MRKALIFGIDYYRSVLNLSGCVNDAYAVKAVLERHADGLSISPLRRYWWQPVHIRKYLGRK